MARIAVILAALLITALNTTAVVAQAPATADKALARIAFGSCADQTREQPIWEAINRAQPDLFIFGGDNVYGDRRNGRRVTDETELLGTLTEAYSRAAALPGMNSLRRTTPHLATWDDHDFGKNDASADFVHKDAAQKLFADFWRLPTDDLRRSRPGVYHAQRFGPPGKRVQIILLDTRYFRSPFKESGQRTAKGAARYVADEMPAKTMLGSAQWAWLERQLSEPADLRLLVSSTQVLPDGKGHESWGNLPHERRRLYDLIERKKAGRVLILSGDRHFGAIFRETMATPYPLTEISSSGLTETVKAARRDSTNAVGTAYTAVNFGTLDIDWQGQVVHAAIRDLGGDTVRQVTVPFAELEVRK
jgi:alkaline phosphatase D